jgi:hypothetical protein
MNKVTIPSSLTYDRSKLKGMIRHFAVHLDIEKTEGAPWVGDAALMQVIHYGTSILIPGGAESALFVLARTFIAVEMVGATVGVKPDDDAGALETDPDASTSQIVREFVADVTNVRTDKSKSGVATHLLYARAALVRIAASQFGIDLMAHLHDIAQRTAHDH